jgi:hypothetical protein
MKQQVSSSNSCFKGRRRETETDRVIEKVFPETSKEFQDVALCRHYFFDHTPDLLFMYTALGPFLSFCISFIHLKSSINYNTKEFVPPFPIPSKKVSDVFMFHPTIIWTGVLRKEESSGMRSCSLNLLTFSVRKPLS